MQQSTMSKTYELRPTKNDKIFRIVDRDGNWEHYAHIESEGAKPTILRGVTTILNKGYAKGAFFEDWLARHTENERAEILSAAGEKGDRVHRAIDLLCNGDSVLDKNDKRSKIERNDHIFSRDAKDETPLSNAEWDALLAFGRFWNGHAPVILFNEEPLFDLGIGVCGTGDAALILTKECGVRTCRCKELVGKIGLWDYKTSSGIRPPYSAQMAVYSRAQNIGDFLPKGRKIEYIAALRLGTQHKTTGGYEMKPFIGDDAMEEAYQRFLAAKKIADFEYTPFDPEKDIEEIPDAIEIIIERPKEEKPEPKEPKKKAPAKKKVTKSTKKK